MYMIGSKTPTGSPLLADFGGGGGVLRRHKPYRSKKAPRFLCVQISDTVCATPLFRVVPETTRNDSLWAWSDILGNRLIPPRDMDKTRNEDLEEFAQAMMGVAPLGSRSRSDRATSTSAPQPPAIRQPAREHPIDISKTKPVDGQEILDWRRPGLRDKDYQNLRRGRFSPPPEEIDLHGQNAREACNSIVNAIARTQQADRRSVCLIHGKGHRSESRGSRLKGLVDAALRQHPEVLGFHSVPGNTGAVNVLLRRARR